MTILLGLRSPQLLLGWQEQAIYEVGTLMAKVHLRQITRENFQECLNLQVQESQKGLVATTTQSLAQAYIDPNLFPLAVYDAAACGYEKPEVPMIASPCMKLRQV